MTGKKWTTKEQEAWLWGQRDEYRVADANNQRRPFYVKVYAAWLLLWPNREPTTQEIAKAGSEEQAMSVIYASRREVSNMIPPHLEFPFYLYFSNSSAGSGIINVFPPPLPLGLKAVPLRHMDLSSSRRSVPRKHGKRTTILPTKTNGRRSSIKPGSNTSRNGKPLTQERISIRRSLHSGTNT